MPCAINNIVLTRRTVTWAHCELTKDVSSIYHPILSRGRRIATLKMRTGDRVGGPGVRVLTTDLGQPVSSARRGPLEWGGIDVLKRLFLPGV